MNRFLSSDEIQRVVQATIQSVKRHGPGFYAWREAPTTEDASAAAEVYQAKLNGVYGERLALSVALLPLLASQGHPVALLQVQDEPTPFDTHTVGW